MLIVIYDHNMFIVQSTGLEYPVLLHMNIMLCKHAALFSTCFNPTH